MNIETHTETLANRRKPWRRSFQRHFQMQFRCRALLHRRLQLSLLLKTWTLSAPSSFYLSNCSMLMAFDVIQFSGNLVPKRAIEMNLIRRKERKLLRLFSAKLKAFNTKAFESLNFKVWNKPINCLKLLKRSPLSKKLYWSLIPFGGRQPQPGRSKKKLPSS